MSRRPIVPPEPARILLADPPWRFGDKLPGKSRGAANNYAVLTPIQIMAFQLPPMLDDSLLLLWRVSSMVEEAYEVCRAWGYVPKSEIVWNKLTASGKPWFGMGRYVRAAHETCIVATRGRFKVDSRSIRSSFSAVVREHSRKPEEFYAIAEALSGAPRVELFARVPRDGWTQYGDQLRGGRSAPPRLISGDNKRGSSAVQISEPWRCD